MAGLRCTPTRTWYAAVGEGRAPVRYDGKGTRDIDLYVRRWSESPDAVDDLIIHVPGKFAHSDGPQVSVTVYSGLGASLVLFRAALLGFPRFELSEWESVGTGFPLQQGVHVTLSR